ncbi:MAG: hypothetical protein J1F35_05800 [Erysipelotrichales bacterium]|nr:hypothetical protein [Erysipelotrichales bacterium]
MKTLNQIISETRHKEISQDFWEEMAEKFINKLKFIDDSEVVSKSIYDLLDWIYMKSFKQDHEYLKEGISKWIEENK